MARIQASLSTIIGILVWFDWMPFVQLSTFSLAKYVLIIMWIALRIFDDKKSLIRSSLIPLLLISSVALEFIYGLMLNIFNNKYGDVIQLNAILIVALLLIKVNYRFDRYTINGFVLGGLLSIIFMVTTLFGYIDTSIWPKFEGLNDWFYTSNKALSTLGFSNKYNKISYLFALNYIILNANLKRRRYLLLIPFLGAIMSTGRGGIIIITLSYLFETRLNLNSLMTFFIVLVGIFWFEPSGKIIEFFVSRDSRSYQYLALPEMLKNHWFYGIGYGSLEMYGFSHFHNFFVSGLVQGGVVSVIIRSAFAALLIRTIFLYQKHSTVRLSLLIFMVVQMIFEDFNPIRIGSTYLIFWLILIHNLNEKNSNSRGLLVN